MKRLVYLYGSILMVSLMMASCSSDNEILSQFSKRKYLKKSGHKSIQKNHKAEEIEYADFINVNPGKILIASSDNEELMVKAAKQNTLVNPSLNLEPREKINKVNDITVDYHKWNGYNRTYRPFRKEAEYNLTHNYANISSVIISPAHWTNIVSLVTGILGGVAAAWVFGAIGVLGDKPGKGYGIAGIVLGFVWLLIIILIII